MSAATSPLDSIVLYDTNGRPMAVQNGVAIPANTPSLLLAGTDGANAQNLTVKPSSSGALSTDNALTIGGGAVTSANNSTVATLAANATFTGVAENVSGYAELTISLAGTPDTATGTLFFEFGPDGVNWDVSVPVVVNNLTVVIPVPLRVVHKFFRIRYINGATIQTAFRLTTYLHRQTPGNLVRTATQTIGANDPVTLVRALIEPSLKGKYRLAGADRSVPNEGIVFPFIGQVRAEFDAALAANDVTATTSGGATVTQAAATAVVLASANAAGASVARIVANKKVRYRPGREFRVEGSMSFTAGIANSTQLFGLSDESGTLNRIAVGYVGATFGLHIYSGGVITTIPRASWNGDALDGSAFSEFRVNNAPVAIDLTKCNQWRIRAKYGIGPVLLEVENPDDGSWVLCHIFRNTNITTTPYIQSPNMFPFAEITKTAGAAVGTLTGVLFSWAGGTVEDPGGFEAHEIQSRKLVNVGIAPQTVSFTAYTVNAGRQLFIKSMNINVVNASLVAAGRLDVIDATAGSAGTLLHSFSLSAATSSAASSVTQPMAMAIPMQSLIGVRFLVQAGTLTFAGSIQGYEKEL